MLSVIRVRFSSLVRSIAETLRAGGPAEAVYQPTVFVTADTADPAWLEASREATGREGIRETSFVGNPWYLVMLSPVVAVVGATTFATLWFGLNALSVAWIGWESAAWAGVSNPWKRMLGGIAAGLLPVAAYGAVLGQNVAPTLGLVMLGVRLAAGGRGAQAAGGLLFALAVLFKPWALLMIAIPGLSRRWIALAVAVALTALWFLTVRPPFFDEALCEDYRAMGRTLVDSTNTAFNNVSIRALLHRLADPDWGSASKLWLPQTADPALARGAQLIAAGIALAFAWPFLKRHRELRLVATAALPLVLLPLGITWTHYLLVFIPALWRWVIQADDLIGRVTGWALILFMLLFPIHSMPLGGPKLFTTPSFAEIEGAPVGWALWFSVPLVLALVLSARTLMVRAPGRPDSARSTKP